MDMSTSPPRRGRPGSGSKAGQLLHPGFCYDYSVFQLEYSRNLLFAYGRQMDRVLTTVLDWTRSRLDVPTLRTC